MLLLLMFIQATVPLYGAPVGVCSRPSLPGVAYEGNMMRAANGTTLPVSCKGRYETSSTSITCVNGKWTDPQPPCVWKKCKLPQNINNGFIDMPCLVVNCTATFTCREGYWYSGTVVRYCQQNKEWSGQQGDCQVVSCQAFPDPKNGKVLQSNRTYLANATVVCDEGYVYSNPNTKTLQCQGNNTWRGNVGTCNISMCSRLSNPSHGMIDQPQRPTYMAKATVKCEEGYVYSQPNHSRRFCLGNNSWSGEEGACDRRQCPELPDVKDGIISPKAGSFNDKIILQCRPGYMEDGPSTITCQADGNWTTRIGWCKKSEDKPDLTSTLAVFSTILTIMIIVIGVGFRWYKYAGSSERIVQTEETISLLGNSGIYCSFKLAEDFSCEYSQKDSPEYRHFGSLLTQEIVKAVELMFSITPVVTITTLIQKPRMVFIEVTCDRKLNENEFAGAMNTLVIKTNNISRCIVYNVVPNSMEFRDKIKHFLVADILLMKHSPDKRPDKTIDFETQYVRLKLLENKTLGKMQRDKLERPDIYQDQLEQFDGTEIQDEDLFQGDDYGKFILLRGRAGIGKSTLVQRLLSKWANGDWATNFKAIFLINIRFLMTKDWNVDLAHLLSQYSLYKTPSHTLNAEWLESNQDKIAIVLDGIDEIQSFQKRWEASNDAAEQTEKTGPLKWCFALMRRYCLPRSTLIVSSRPFAGLSAIQQTLQKSGLAEKLSLVELMGLTRKRVMTFIKRNVAVERQDFVKQTLIKSPILLSVCAITFYCSALCDLLADRDTLPHNMTTYTHITAYIIQTYIKRSLRCCDGDLPAMFDETVKTDLELLSQLAFDGLLSVGSESLPKLVFADRTFDRLEVTKPQLERMKEIGLLMETEIRNPETQGETEILRQFAHLSVQEFLAMCGLLKKGPEKGLPSDLQALQVSHESQSAEVAREVGRLKFPDGVISVKGVKLTVIDIIAMIFMMKHHATVHTIRLKHVGLDGISVREICNCLKHTMCLKTLELTDNSVNDDSLGDLMEIVGNNNSIQTFIFASTQVSDDGLKKFADALKGNSVLQVLNLSSDGIGDKTVKALASSLKRIPALEQLSLTSHGMSHNSMNELAKALSTHLNVKVISLTSEKITDEVVNGISILLTTNTALHELRLVSSQITDKGIIIIARVVAGSNTLNTLRLYGFHMKDEGTLAILEMLKKRQDMRVHMWDPVCGDEMYDNFSRHQQIEIH